MLKIFKHLIVWLLLAINYKKKGWALRTEHWGVVRRSWDQRRESGSEQFKLERVTLLNRFAYCNVFWQKANNKAYYGQLFIVVHSGLCVLCCVVLCVTDLWVLSFESYAPVFERTLDLFYFVVASKYFQQSWFACLNTFF